MSQEPRLKNMGNQESEFSLDSEEQQRITPMPLHTPTECIPVRSKASETEVDQQDLDPMPGRTLSERSVSVDRGIIMMVGEMFACPRGCGQVAVQPAPRHCSAKIAQFPPWWNPDLGQGILLGGSPRDPISQTGLSMLPPGPLQAYHLVRAGEALPGRLLA